MMLTPALARTVLIAAALAAGGASWAQDARALHTRSLAATCAHCHGTDGRAVPGETPAPLAGRPKERLLEQLAGYRSGQLPASVMTQIARGYTTAQLDAIAGYFAAQR